MILANYINDLLYRYDCVIIPDFGGFVTNTIGAKIDSHSFYPPKKQITFNTHLKHNDGLLANYIASSENISFEKAAATISLSVIKWKNELRSNSVNINNVGVLSLNKENQIIFEPNATVNYLTDSFGLATIESAAIERYKQQAKPLITVTKKKGVPAFIKYAATAAILLTLGYTGFNSYKNNKQKEILANKEEALEKKIQSATFVISNPLPTIELNIAKETTKPYHIIAGAFQFKENAKKKVNQLKAKGFDSKIIGINKWGLTQVTFNSYSSRKEATNNLYKIQDTISEDAWLLIKN